MAAGNRFIVPAIADFEVRRELLRAGKTRGLARLNAWNASDPDRYLPLTDTALQRAAVLWAQARNQGTPTAGMRELDCDVLIAAQVLESGIGIDELIVATVNVAHIFLFVPADDWRNIRP